MADAPRNWARASKVWFPISSLPRGGPPVVLANEDQTVHWLVDKPNRTAIKHTRHVHDEQGLYQYHPHSDGDDEQKPVVETVTLKPEWWSPAVYVDAEGRPAHE